MAIGFFLVVKGADLFVNAASDLARRLRVSQLVIGLTVVAFGTSLPELAVNLTASVNGNSGITVGNIRQYHRKQYREYFVDPWCIRSHYALGGHQGYGMERDTSQPPGLHCDRYHGQ